MTNTPYAWLSNETEAVTPQPRPAVELRNVVKTYGEGSDTMVRALDGVTVDFAPGTFTAVMGPSGSGKSSLLHCAAGLDRPASGSVTVDGVDLESLDEVQLTMLRRDRIGFIFQAFNLLPTLTVGQNVTLPVELGGRRADRGAVRRLLGRLGVADRVDHLPAQLSGGQQQRVAIARAVLADPAVIFADEPTGALDTNAAREVLELLRATVEEMGRTIIMVTHDPVAAAYAGSVVFLANGQIVDALVRPTVDQVATRMAHLSDGGQN